MDLWVRPLKFSKSMHPLSLCKVNINKTRTRNGDWQGYTMELSTNNREIRNAIWGRFVIMWKHGVHLRRYKIATTTKSLWILSSFLCLLVSSSEFKEREHFIVLKFRFSISTIYNPYRPRMVSKWFVFKAYWYQKKRCQRTEWGAGWNNSNKLTLASMTLAQSTEA